MQVDDFFRQDVDAWALQSEGGARPGHLLQEDAGWRHLSQGDAQNGAPS